MSNLKVMRDGIRIGKFIFRERFRVTARPVPIAGKSLLTEHESVSSLIADETEDRAAVVEATLP
jgi:hypothetical protein